MFVPSINRVDDDTEIRRLVGHARTAQFVTVGEDGFPVATLLPIIWTGDVVLAHMAKANPQWHQLSDDSPCLLVCSGPDAYVSPSWYATKAEHGRVVPTWNYSAVHLSGTVTVHDDRDWLRDMVTRLTDMHEDHRDARWRVGDAPENYITGQLRGIVGLEVIVTRVEAKAKLSQNRSVADRQGVIDGLRHEHFGGTHEIADAMASHM